MKHYNKKIWYVKSNHGEHTSCPLTLDLAAKLADLLVKDGYKNVEVYMGQHKLTFD